ncbi:MAG: GNAT family N-acetyltransferase [Clostridia bacterium]|nr:GNAT family N-acetyltransferase [Clostridia bacterium]
MDQLKLIRPPKPPKEIPLPEGCRYEFYSGGRDQTEDWLNICKEGLIDPGSGEEVFRDAILCYPDLVPEKDLIFVLSPEGKRVATVAFVKHKDGSGYLHMVCCLKEYRGKGIGDAMNSFALAQLYGRDVSYTYLTTDDFRLGAIKIYLRAGFVPCEDTPEMKERWAKVLSRLEMTDPAGN